MQTTSDPKKYGVDVKAMSVKDLIDKYEKKIKEFQKTLTQLKMRNKGINDYVNISFLEIKIESCEQFITDLKQLEDK